MVDNITSCTRHKSNGFFRSYVNNLRPLGKEANSYDVNRAWFRIRGDGFAAIRTALGEGSPAAVG
jgi:hypothetical protein